MESTAKLYILAIYLTNTSALLLIAGSLEISLLVYSLCDSFLGIGGREPLVSIFPKCIDVLRCRIVQCGGESHHMR